MRKKPNIKYEITDEEITEILAALKSSYSAMGLAILLIGAVVTNKKEK